jgi:hypothetical protein
LIFSDQLEYYQAIANELNEIISESWSSVEVEARLFEDSINLKVVYLRPDGSRESDLEEIMLPEYFYELAQAVSDEENGMYKKCDFVLTKDGKFTVNFEY